MGKQKFEIYSSLRSEYGNWRIRTHYELEKLTNGLIIIRFIKTQGLKCLGQIARMETIIP
jgi:hypothetical protein